MCRNRTTGGSPFTPLRVRRSTNRKIDNRMPDQPGPIVHQNLVAIDRAVLALIVAAFVRPNRTSRLWSHDSINAAVVVSRASQPTLQLRDRGSSAVTIALAVSLIAVAVSLIAVTVPLIAVVVPLIAVAVSVRVAVTIAVPVRVVVTIAVISVWKTPAPERKAEAADENVIIIIMVMAPIAIPIASAPALPTPITAVPIAAAPSAAPPTLATPCAHSAASKRVPATRWHRSEMPATVAALRSSAYCGCSQRNRGETT